MGHEQVGEAHCHFGVTAAHGSRSHLRAIPLELQDLVSELPEACANTPFTGHAVDPVADRGSCAIASRGSCAVPNELGAMPFDEVGSHATALECFVLERVAQERQIRLHALYMDSGERRQHHR